MIQRACVAILLIACLSNVAAADIIMNLDTTTKRAFLSGTATGTTGAAGGGTSQVRWDSGGLPFFGDFSFNSSTLTLVGSTTFGGVLNVDDTFVSLDFSFSTPTGAGVLNGGGPSNFFDYSGFSNTRMNLLEGLVGNSLPLSAGSGFGSLQVAAVAVPEPGSLSCLGLALAGGATRWRKRRTG